MWIEILCGLIFYRLFRCFFYQDDVMDVESSDTNAIFAVAHRLQKLYGGNVYIGLRIPDADTGSPQSIDIVLVTKGELAVISVKNFSGFLSIDSAGNWVCERTGRHKSERHPDPVIEARKQASILESYLERRGVTLPEGYISCKVILPNPKLCTISESSFPSEIIAHEQWVQLKPGSKSKLSGWMKSAFLGGKKEMQESVNQNLDSILSTAPIWDRLELKGSKYILGEFLEFKGKQEDVQALRNIKRSKVSRLTIQQTSMFGLAPSKLQVLYDERDYRTEGASATEWKEVNVRSSTEVIFQPQNASKVRKFKLSSVISMTLSA
ncbi:Plasma membrane isoform 1 [Senna tora]|uniref:Plasma membrane isoform 1 n=1 Tax=Senna tora TaxID=362788 RepID=A0A834TMB8_9FABA|nr:Plasma membrane isoform 1 [Senna tora]